MEPAPSAGLPEKHHRYHNHDHHSANGHNSKAEESTEASSPELSFCLLQQRVESRRVHVLQPEVQIFRSFLSLLRKQQTVRYGLGSSLVWIYLTCCQRELSPLDIRPD